MPNHKTYHRKRATLRELYDAELQKPTAGQKFVADIARVTWKSEAAVRAWISGRQVPDDLTRSVLAEHLGADPDSLFPRQAGGEQRT